ncbi:T9SS type A sorting domain-containing protein [uncultured Aquimarina sp.]|uniref:T9SS type A sorting domain-containing protein n=1 Tax=uncultured Aquimarina sp. TaxID=575652 RepID=UPI00261A6CC6|nr:T9SS type A sorting domain-containing protein [uncultured Aquimarina sp.]
MKTYFLKLKCVITLFMGLIAHATFGQCSLGQPNISIQAEAFSNITIVEGTTVTLTSPVSGSTYQWTATFGANINAANVSGATTSTLTITNFNNENLGGYNVIVDGIELPNSISLGIFNSSISDYDRDRQALIGLYNDTNGKDWLRNTNWLTGPMETWEGVKVENCRVTGLSLSSNNMDGTIPSSFKNLTALKRIGMSNNDKLSGILDISDMLGLLQLFTFNSNLEDIVFGSNVLLQSIEIQNNPFIVGKTIDISSMRQLIDLNISNLGLDNLIVSATGDYNNLQNFRIRDNNISGILDISNMPNLKTCFAHNNQFTDFILGTGAELQRFYFYNNPVVSGGEKDISGMRKLIEFNVKGLGLSTLIISGMYNEMLNLIIRDNNLGGALDISNMPKIRTCSADNNDFEELILPSNVFGDSRTLNNLYVRNNKLDFGDLLLYNSTFESFNFSYNPQQDVPTEVVGNRVSVDVDGMDMGNVYTWTPPRLVNESFFIATVDGLYSCAVTNTTGGPTGLGVPGLTIQSIPEPVVVTSTRSTDDSSFDKRFDRNEEIKVYPNPIKKGTSIYSDVSLGIIKPVNFTLYSLNGKKMKEFNFEGKVGLNTFQLNSEGLSSGQYILTSEFGAKKVSSMIIIQ